MAYPQGSILTARTVALDPSRYSGLLNGLSTLEQALQSVDKLSGIGDRCVTNLLTRDPSVVTAGTWIRALNAGMLWNGGYTNFGASVTLDEIIVNMYAPSTGTYSLRFCAPLTPGSGILKLFRGATQIGVAPAGYDLYAALLNPYNYITVAGLAMTAGSNPITFRVDGKNGASAAWDLWFTEIEIRRTA